MRILPTCVVAVAVAAPLLADGDPAVDLAPVNVESTAISKYHSAEVSTATFDGTPPHELSQMVDVLTEDFIRETAPLDLHDLLRYQPGIYTGGKTLQSRTAGQYNIRGLSGSEVTLDGSLPLPGFMGTFMDPSALERVEIVKGPVGATQGGSGSSLGPYGAGGSVNLVSKCAVPGQVIRNTGASAIVGDGTQRYRLHADVNHPVSDTAAFRAPVQIETGKSFWLPGDHDWRQNYFVAPSFSVMGDTVDLVLNTTLQYTDQPGYQGIPIYQGEPWGGYDWDSYIPETDMRDVYLGLTLQGWMDWRASDSLTLRTGAGLARAEVDSEHLGSAPFASPAYHQNPYEYSKYDLEYLNWNVFQRAVKELEIGGVPQTLVAQVDYTEKRQEGDGGFGNVSSPTDLRLDRSSSRDSEIGRVGVLAQDSLRFGMARLLVGARWDRHESDLGNSGESLSPRIGLSLLPSEQVVVFGNVSVTESPNFGYMKSETEELTSSWNAQQMEVGFRYAPVKALWLTVAYFDIQQENTPSYDPRTTYYGEEGETQSKGVEVSLVGDISPNWSVYVAYSHIDYENVADDIDFDRYPPNALTASTSYQFQSGPMKDLVLNAAYRFRDRYDATFRGDYVGEEYFIDESHVFDFWVSAPLAKFGGPEDWNVRVGVKNLFDEQYVESNRHYYQGFPGDPRVAEFALSGSF